jgi:hypothetical protein
MELNENKRYFLCRMAEAVNESSVGDVITLAVITVIQYPSYAEIEESGITRK